MLAERRRDSELMDDPALDASTYHAVLADIARVNRTTFAYRPTLSFLARAVGRRARFSLLDVGFGDGDMLRAMRRRFAQAAIARSMSPSPKPTSSRLKRARLPTARARNDSVGR